MLITRHISSVLADLFSFVVFIIGLVARIVHLSIVIVCHRVCGWYRVGAPVSCMRVIDLRFPRLRPLFSRQCHCDVVVVILVLGQCIRRAEAKSRTNVHVKIPHAGLTSPLTAGFNRSLLRLWMIASGVGTISDVYRGSRHRQSSTPSSSGGVFSRNCA